MNPEYKDFLQSKEKISEENKSKNSERTLKYYEALQEAVEREEYERSWDYLNSVKEYIEKNEYITDKQIKIVDVILSHPEAEIESEYSGYRYERYDNDD